MVLPELNWLWKRMEQWSDRLGMNNPRRFTYCVCRPRALQRGLPSSNDRWSDVAAGFVPPTGLAVVTSFPVKDFPVKDDVLR
jgi:hypothetical protein